MADVTMVFDAEVAKAVQGFLRLEDRETALEAKLTKLKASSADLHSSSIRGLGDWSSSLGSLLAKFGSITAAIGLATKAHAEWTAERARAGGEAAKGEQLVGGMAAFAKGPEDLRRIKATMDQLRSREGMEPEQAAALTRTLAEQGKLDQAGMYGKMSLWSKPSVMAEAVERTQGILPGAGTDRQLVNKFITAGQIAGKAPEEIAAGAAGLAPAAKLTGADPDKLLAALSIASRRMNDVNGAAAGLETITKQAARKLHINIAQEGFGGLAEKIEKRGFDKTRMLRTFKSPEAVEVLDALIQGRGELQKAEAEIGAAGRAGPGGDALARKSRAVEEVFSNERALRQLKQQRAIAEGRQSGQDAVKAQTIREAVGESMLQEGVGPSRHVVNVMATALDKTVGLDTLAPGGAYPALKPVRDYAEMQRDRGVSVRSAIPGTQVVEIRDQRSPDFKRTNRTE